MSMIKFTRMATLRTAPLCKQLSTTWCKRKYAFLYSSFATRTPKTGNRIAIASDKRMNNRSVAKPKHDGVPNNLPTTEADVRPTAKLYSVPKISPTIKSVAIHEPKLHGISGIRPTINTVDVPESEHHGIPEKDNSEENVDNTLNIDAVKRVLSQFSHTAEVNKMCKDANMTYAIFRSTFRSFSSICLNETMSPELYDLMFDLTKKKGSTVSLFPLFLQHAHTLFPHLKHLSQLKSISDLTLPAKWYTDARERTRKIVLHVGPTNSGKTHHAMQMFLNAKTAVYCCPLRLLALEISDKSIEEGVPCDLRTGELIRFANEDKTPGTHLACTIEMTDVQEHYDVAVIDEIQMIRSRDRGWAWTRAVLGVNADEVHICGEESAVPLIENLTKLTKDEFEVKTYQRLTPLKLLDEAVEDWTNIRPGDCIICFSKETIFEVSAKLNKLGIQIAIIYGTLPPATKIAQARKFNDPLDPCKVLVATDAIGMGVNLNIGRIIFYTLTKKKSAHNGKTVHRIINASEAKHIAGRSGRFGTRYPNGEVTTFRKSDLPDLYKLFRREVTPIKSAGLKPTPEQMEMFSYQLPDASLKELLDTFESMAKHDTENFFMCDLHQMKQLAIIVDEIGLPMRDRFFYSQAPIDIESEKECNAYIECARKHYNEEPINITWLMRLLGWPLKMPETTAGLREMEAVFGCLDNYLWFSKYFPTIYHEEHRVRAIQKELETWIEIGLVTCLLKKLSWSETIKLKSQSVKEPELAGIADKLKREKTFIEESDSPTKTIGKTETGGEKSVAELLKFLKKGGISEKRLMRLSKDLDADSMLNEAESKLGKHPRKDKFNKKKYLKDLEKWLKDKK
ncbi:ATP-dependent RNA helicase SUV3 homolog, mitochondrial-like [Ylistrum balloti]|uniref:ATP-dependent RNA helicase SUV3 homolog, mitochondrial-like n=1 Tax=Ylistrum balloti TaxID=509963 RepID=UPI0029059BF3|nr:ATP-dependent RNA helicase SUV3 homolog, mitochondrial-like [Ylistrum balloti]